MTNAVFWGKVKEGHLGVLSRKATMSTISSESQTVSSDGLVMGVEHTTGGMFRLSFRKPTGENVIAIDLPVIALCQVQTEISVRLTEFMQMCAAQAAK